MDGHGHAGRTPAEGEEAGAEVEAGAEAEAEAEAGAAAAAEVAAEAHGARRTCHGRPPRYPLIVSFAYTEPSM